MANEMYSFSVNNAHDTLALTTTNDCDVLSEFGIIMLETLQPAIKECALQYMTYYLEPMIKQFVEQTINQYFLKLTQFLVGRFLNLDSLNNADTTGISEGAENDMPKQLKERVQVGLAENGKPDYKWATGYNRQELLLNAAQILQDHGKLESAPNPPAAKQHLFADYAESYYSLYKDDTLRHTTISSQRSLLNKHLIPEFGHLDITEITVDMIQKMLNNKKSYAKKTLQEMVMVLGMILESAVEDGIISRNPAKSQKLSNPSKQKTERKALTEEEIQDIIAHIPELSQARDRRYLALLAYTGMRREEVLGLRWDDIDMNANPPVFHVQRAITFKGNKAIVGDTKTENGVRDVPIHPDLIQWLTHEDNNTEYIVQDNITQQIVKNMWKRISKEINVYDATPHCFRHTFTTICRRSGMDEKTMQKLGGWSDIETMRKHYTHVQNKDILNAAQIMNGMFKASATPVM